MSGTSVHSSRRTWQGRRGFLWLLLLLTVAVGIAYSLRLAGHLRFADEKEYYGLAVNLARIRQYSLYGEEPSVFRPPGYPLLLSVFTFLRAGVVHLRILNFLLLAGCIYAVYRIIELQLSYRAARIGALLVLCYPVLFYTAGSLYPTTLASLLFLLAIRLLAGPDRRLRECVLLGILFGLLILTVPMFAFTLLTVALWMLFTKWAGGAKGVVVTVVTAILICSVWSARNLVVFHSFAPVSANSGLNLLLGNSERTSPDAGFNVDISRYTRNTQAMDDVQRDAYYRSKAWEFIVKHKGRTLRLYALKVLHYFSCYDDTRTPAVPRWPTHAAMLATYGPLLLLFIARIALHRRFLFTQFEILLALLYFSNAFYTAIFFTRIRFRLPFDFVLIIVGAMFVDALIRWRRKSTLRGKA